MKKRNMTAPVKMGYALYVKTAEMKRMERVGGLFHYSTEAATYKDKHYPGVGKWSIQAVRLRGNPLGDGGNG